MGFFFFSLFFLEMTHLNVFPYAGGVRCWIMPFAKCKHDYWYCYCSTVKLWGCETFGAIETAPIKTTPKHNLLYIRISESGLMYNFFLLLLLPSYGGDDITCGLAQKMWCFLFRNTVSTVRVAILFSATGVQFNKQTYCRL